MKTAKSESRATPRQIVGISMSPALAAEVKLEATKRGISLKRLFQEMWSSYKVGRKAK